MDPKTVLCDLIPFLEHYGSPLSICPADISACKNYLRRAELLGEVGWKEIPTLASETGDNLVDSFMNLVKAIWAFAKQQKACHNGYTFDMLTLSGAAETEDPGPVAGILEDLNGEEITNEAIVMPFELNHKRQKEQQSTLREQLVERSRRIMCDDPRRMFIFGATIDGRRLSLWYFSRSHSVKTRDFDWTDKESVDTFIRMVLTFAYASPNDFGIDPHVHKSSLSAGTTQQYVHELTVPQTSINLAPPREDPSMPSTPTPDVADAMVKVYYRTVKRCGPTWRLPISGRSTRVWEVVQVSSIDELPTDDAKRLILKDVWIENNTPTEAQNQRAMFAAVDRFVADGVSAHPGPGALRRFIDCEPRFQHFDDKTKERLAELFTGGKYKELFLTNVLEWKGEYTKKLPAAACFLSPGLPTTSEIFGQGSPNSMPAVTPLASHDAERRFPRRQQVRLVYEEVCTEIYKLPNLGAVMEIIRQTLDALVILYCAGWVHRDISTGNILAVPSGEGGSWKVKLADFEFAKEFGLATNEVDQAGTPYFMAVEIMASKCLAFAGEQTETKVEDTLSRYTFAKVRNLATRFRLQRDHQDYNHFARFKWELLLDLTELPELKNHEPLSSTFYGHN